MKTPERIDMVRASASMSEVAAQIDRVARSDAKVLITGESGVGKEVVARAIHQESGRNSGPFVAVNCAGIPETLLESELFGHVEGSFTGAYRGRSGLLETANGGTVFLDEIGEMTLRMQALFLRFLETGEIQRVGADRIAGGLDVRVIAATNRNMRQQITHGQFREDLYYRLNVIHIAVPPLRERREDIPALVETFLKACTVNERALAATAPRPPVGIALATSRRTRAAGGAADAGLTPIDTFRPGVAPSVARVLTPQAMAALCRYSWPGNVRELENVIERMVVNGVPDVIGWEHLPLEIRSPSHQRPPSERRRSVADELFEKLVDDGQPFWTTVYPLYMNREITRGHLKDLVHKGLNEARGNYKVVLRLFNIESRDYKRFLNFLRKHECQLPFREYRR
jgi:transcriptional regulator with PAS, ATPase and Fis domain